MAETTLLAPLGWLAAPLFKTLFDKAHHHLGTSIDEKMKILQATVLPRLSLAIERAEKSPNKGKLVDWLKRLKSAYYEAEEVIDLFEYELLKQKVKHERKTLEQKKKNQRGTRISSPTQFVLKRLKIASIKIKSSLSVFSRQKVMLKGCIDKLIEIAKEANEFHDLLEVQENDRHSDSDRETHSDPPIRVFGRDIDKENIVSILTKEPLNYHPEQAICIIAITGRSGVGKTTLAQYVYNYIDVQEHFDLCVWVHAPRKFKVTDVIKNMIEIIKAEQCTRNDYPLTCLEALKKQLKSMLVSKKLLLVLDDFWSDADNFKTQWENFMGCLRCCLPGSRILLTTQSKNAAEHVDHASIRKVNSYYLREIEEDQFFYLFMHYAWPSDCHPQKKVFEQKKEFHQIGRKIAVKLKGDPGAAMLVGHQLSRKLDLLHWEKVAKEDCLGDNMKARIWSYQQLRPEHQRCFAICSLFPKGFMFRIEYLIDSWIAEGFIGASDNQKRLEDIGQDYLNELVSRFFIEQFVVNNVIFFQLHDLLHDLAERVQGDDLIRIDSANSRDPSKISRKVCRNEDIRHINLPSSMINEEKENLCIMKNLCTFIVQPDGGFVPKEVLQEIFRNLNKLRVLVFPDCDDWPDSIGNLKHLRLLSWRGSSHLKKLPDSICKLYHLQKLYLPIVESLPKDFSALINLRNCYAFGKTLTHISHVGRLTSLQCLDQFGVRKEHGYELHQLENLNQLRGKMCITGLENVVSTEDAVRTNLQNKKHLEVLAFEWNSNKRDNNNVTGLSTQHVQLLEAL